jgi:hypothetical protein
MLSQIDKASACFDQVEIFVPKLLRSTITLTLINQKQPIGDCLGYKAPSGIKINFVLI